MFELMKQMKQCVHNNPNEAKNLLMSNPQLAYAQVVMRIVDPQVAIAMLHRETPAISQPFHQQTPPTFPAGLPFADGIGISLVVLTSLTMYRLSLIRHCL
uniref:Cleavage stimulation factor subunit 2 hinge domain-containing protein n=1 Tax=Parascaris equorum TaxID=6256 RepID=A0A914RS39_PAREQ